MLSKGDIVEDQYGIKGFVSQLYDDFSACNMSCLTITGNQWLEQQIIPFTTDELKEKWYQVTAFDGGSIWACESRLTLLYKAIKNDRQRYNCKFN